MTQAQKRLYLVRHAKSSWNDPSLSDEARPLNERGQHDAPLMGQWLAQQPLPPQHILSSPARRAHSTAQILAAALAMDPQSVAIDPDIYFRGVRGMLAAIERSDDEVDQLMLVGHNPVMTALFRELSGEPLDNFPTCAIAVIDFAMESWGLVDSTPGQLVAYQAPHDLAV